jgi:hypothetical protein
VGCDEGLGSWFTQLYKDHEPVDEDDTLTWLSGIHHKYRSTEELAVGIAEATGLRLRRIRKAMAISERYPVG